MGCPTLCNMVFGWSLCRKNIENTALMSVARQYKRKGNVEAYVLAKASFPVAPPGQRIRLLGDSPTHPHMALMKTLHFA